MIGGHPDLARELTGWLFAAEEHGGNVDVEDEDEGFEHKFGKKEIELDHNEGDLEPIKIQTDECMEYLTNGVNPFELLKVPLVQDNKALLWRMAAVPVDATAVDVFDSATWPIEEDGTKHDFKPLLDEIHKRIAPHCVHGQGVENHVQAAGFVRKTNVGEERGSHRGVAHSYIIRASNIKAKSELRAKKETKEEKDKVKRAYGCVKINSFSEFTEGLRRTVNKAAAEMNRDQKNELYTFLGSEECRQSTKDKKQLVKKIKTGAKKKRKVTKSESSSNVEVPPEMDGGIKFSILTKKNGFEPHVDAEIVERKIEYKLSLPLVVSAEEGGQVAPWKEKMKLLKKEALLDMVESGRAAAGDKLPNYIVPKSDMMKSLYQKQRDILDEKRANKS